MSRGRHARDGQRRDALAAWRRGTWVRLRREAALWVRHPVASVVYASRYWDWPVVQAHWLRQYKRADRKAFLAECAAMTPARIPVRAPGDPRTGRREVRDRRPGGRNTRPPSPAEIREAPHLPGCDGECGGLAAHQEHLDDGWCPCCYCAQFASGGTVRHWPAWPAHPPAPGAAPGQAQHSGTPPPDAAPPPGAAAAPAPITVTPRGPGQPVHWHRPDGSVTVIGYGPTAQIRAPYAQARVTGAHAIIPGSAPLVPRWYAAHEARRDMAVTW